MHWKYDGLGEKTDGRKGVKQMGKQIFTTEQGEMAVLRYEAYSREGRAFDQYLGVQLIAYFKGNDNWGQDGDRITFVQLVKDTFYGKTETEEKRYYPWKMDKTNVCTEGDISGEEVNELDWTIDQIRESCGNTDFRYTEKRTSIDAPMSSQESKTEALMAMSEEGLLEYHFFALRGKKAEEKKEYIERHMFSDENPLPDVVFSAEKKEGKWRMARMSDTPCTVCNGRLPIHDGGQEFQLAVLYEKSGGEKEIIGTLFWGWKYQKEVERGNVKHLAKLLDLKFQPGCTDEMRSAVAAWNRKERYMKIEGLTA